MTILDLKDPADPIRLSSTPILGRVDSIQVEALVAYVTAGGIFVLFDVSRPTAPKILSAYITYENEILVLGCPQSIRDSLGWNHIHPTSKIEDFRVKGNYL